MDDSNNQDDHGITGPFTSQKTSFPTLEAFVQRLSAAGFQGTTQWLRGKSPVAPDQAQLLEISVAGKLVLRHNGRGGLIDTKPLSEAQKAILLEQIDEQGLIVEPGRDLALWLGILYCALQIFVITAWLGDTSSQLDGMLGILPILGFISSLIGTVIMISRTESSLATRSMIVPGLFLVPGFILTVPSALLLLPAITYSPRKAVFTAFREHLSQGTAAPQAL